MEIISGFLIVEVDNKDDSSDVISKEDSLFNVKQ